jgi:uncharacterized protein with GYD domain
MAKYVILCSFTQQGISTITESPKRRAAARKVAKSLGGSIDQVYLTIGQYDLVVIADLPDDEAVAKMLLRIGSQGNISTQTLRAFDEKAQDKLIASL